MSKLKKIVEMELTLGATLLHHTGHIYGIGCKLSDKQAIKRIQEQKLRSDRMGLIALVCDINWFINNEIMIPERLNKLLEQYWPGNLTIVIPCTDPRFEHIAQEGKVAFRVPSDPMLRAIIDLGGEPFISTSINISGLPPENDYTRIRKNHEKWFDLGIIPNPKEVPPLANPSTVIEYIPASTSNAKDEIKCLREGSIPFYEVKKSFETPVVMFVCTANICRSPIAEYLFNHLVKKEKINIIGDSSGLMESGNMISVNSLQLLLEHGISEAQIHLSQQISPQLVSNSWLILTMEERQRDFLRQNTPASTHKIFTLNEIVGESGDVEDPYGTDVDSYRKTYEIIEDRLKRLIGKIKQDTIYQG